MAGYPGKPLLKKLGVKAGHKVCLLNAPDSFSRHLEQNDVRITHDLRLPPVDVVVLFVDRIADLERRVGDIVARLHPRGGFWVAYRTSGRGSDITEDVVCRIALAAGMVQNKICEIDASWSGVRLVLRNEIRDAIAYREVPPPPPLSRRVRRTTAAARLARLSTSGAGSTLRRARARSTK
ncbi:MAG: DUF3052 family protein [Deltaproteobacteria bacterium]|nr:MAG: DUF3052 family protein [Deltaproteobacteria bacterium]